MTICVINSEARRGPRNLRRYHGGSRLHLRSLSLTKVEHLCAVPHIVLDHIKMSTIHVAKRPKRLLKVRTGCVTCEIRKVKCDEGKPFCKRCCETGRNCDGYAVQPATRKKTGSDRLLTSQD